MSPSVANYQLTEEKTKYIFKCSCLAVWASTIPASETGSLIRTPLEFLLHLSSTGKHFRQDHFLHVVNIHKNRMVCQYSQNLSSTCRLSASPSGHYWAGCTCDHRSQKSSCTASSPTVLIHGNVDICQFQPGVGNILVFFFFRQPYRLNQSNWKAKQWNKLKHGHGMPSASSVRETFTLFCLYDSMQLNFVADMWMGEFFEIYFV